jgi:hypothetical protein
MQRPNFLPFDIAGAILRVQKQSPAVGVQRDSHGIQGKITALQIFKNHARPDLRQLPRPGSNFLVALGNSNSNAIAEIQLCCATAFVNA